MFTPKIGEDEPNLAHIFQMGLVQPPTRSSWGLKTHTSQPHGGPDLETNLHRVEIDGWAARWVSMVGASIS